MMASVVKRDEAAVAELLAGRPCAESVYATPTSNFWTWADNYGDEPLTLVMPPGDVADWGVWGFPLQDGRLGELALHVDVWTDSGQTDLTIEFRLIPEREGYRVELDDMHVM